MQGYSAQSHGRGPPLGIGQVPITVNRRVVQPAPQSRSRLNGGFADTVRQSWAIATTSTSTRAPVERKTGVGASMGRPSTGSSRSRARDTRTKLFALRPSTAFPKTRRGLSSATSLTSPSSSRFAAFALAEVSERFALAEIVANSAEERRLLLPAHARGNLDHDAATARVTSLPLTQARCLRTREPHRPDVAAWLTQIRLGTPRGRVLALAGGRG